MFLRGAGCAMALPWLESGPVWGASTTASPKRFAVVFMGNGVNGNHWWSKGNGDEMKLSKSLEPLDPVKKKLNVINGLYNRPPSDREFIPVRPATCSRACRSSAEPTSEVASRWTR